MTTRTVQLYRDSLNTPWGFRLQGGKDLSQPLVIQRVFSNSPAEGELQRGDLILSINGRDTQSYTHKQAQDLIKFGGGSLQLVIERPPPGRVYVAPVTPRPNTKAPSLPQSPTRAPTVVIPIQRRHSNPPSPIRSPVRSPARTFIGKTESVSSMPQPYTSGFKPKKITLNKYGGGGYDFGTVPSPQYKPVRPSFMNPDVQQQNQYSEVVDQQHHYATLPARHTYRAPPAPVSVAETVDDSHMYHRPTQQQLPPEDRGVEEEEYGGVSERRKNFLRVEQRRAPVKRTHKTFTPSRPLGEGMSFGVDYVSGQGMAPQAPSKAAPRARPKPVNAAPQDDSEFPWSSTLKSEGLKPWEREQIIQDAYQNQPSHSPIRPGVSPIPVPPPKPKKITVQNQQPQYSSQAGQSKPQVPLGERDWSDSYVYKMIHEEKKTSSQGVPGQPNQTVTTTRVTNESQQPGQAPKRTVQESVTTSSLDSRFDQGLGISDF